MKKWLENLKISKKLAVSFGIICLVTVIVGSVGVINIFRIKNADFNLYQDYTQGLEDAGNAAVNFQQLRYDIYKLRKSEGSAQSDINSAISSVETSAATVEECLIECDASLGGGEFSSQYEAIRNMWSEYVILANEDLDAAKENNFDILMKNSTNLGSQGTTIRDSFTTLFDNLSLSASEQSSSNVKLAYVAAVLMVIVALAGIILSVLLTRYLSGSISYPIRKCAELSELIAVGDTDVNKVLEEKDKLWSFRKDETGLLANSFDKIIASTTEQAQNMRAVADGDLTTAITVRSESDTLGKALSELVEKFHALSVSIVTSADQVDSGAKQVADSSASLSQGASEQASSVEELTASLEEITSQTTHNAQNAQTTDELAKNIKKDAETGNTQMAQMLRAMDEINVSSDNIKKIIKVIEDIAFQTNILALNAAVEAARAGQYGKGFAVVAEEVRNLAAQSSKAAKETTDLIENSITKVETGTKIANETADALSKIVLGISKTSDLIDAIARSSQEQSIALEQINQGITQVSQVVQSNAAVSEECAASSEELSIQAEHLKQSVSVFKLNMGGSSLGVIPKSLDTRDEKTDEQKSKEQNMVPNTGRAKITLIDNHFGKC